MCSNRMIEKLFNQEQKKITEMNQEIWIKDLFVSAYDEEQSYGESKFKGKRSPSFLRLIKHIRMIATIANQYHEDKHFEQSDGVILMKKTCLNNITRISLSEFSLYTQKPLSLKMFSCLIKVIEELAKKCHPNLHLLLGTISVKLQDDTFGNYAIYVQCGSPPVLDIFAKTCVSTSDIEYKKMNMFDRQDKYNPTKMYKEFIVASLPQDKKGIAVSQKPIIKAKTEGGSEFIVLVEICLEHRARRAKKIFCHELNSLFLGEDSNYIPVQVSHVITSNTINPRKKSMIGYTVTHANAIYGEVLAFPPKKEVPLIVNPGIDPAKYQAIIKKFSLNTNVEMLEQGMTVENPPFGSNYKITFSSEFSLLEHGLNTYFLKKVNTLNQVLAGRRALTLFKYNGIKCKNPKHEKELNQLMYHI